MQKAQLMRAYLERPNQGEIADERTYGELVSALDQEIAQLRARVAKAEIEPAAEVRPAARSLRDALKSTLTDDVPKDPAPRLQRAALLRALVSRIELDDDGD